MNLLLNIGLDSDNRNIDLGTVLRELANMRVTVYAYAVHTSDTERTVVAQISASPNTNIYHLAVLLGQDCIAVYNPDVRVGQLVGPKAADWGTFNPEFFLLLDGTRLAAPFAQAA